MLRHAQRSELAGADTDQTGTTTPASGELDIAVEAPLEREPRPWTLLSKLST